MTRTCSRLLSLSSIMGSGSSKMTEEDKRRNQQIDKMLADSKKQISATFKMLLLGPGDSGKSTIVKQMRILHSSGFDKEEIAAQQSVIAGNILTSISTIIKAMGEFGMKYQAAEREADSMHVRNLERTWTYGGTLNAGDWACLKRLWKDDGVQACFRRANEYQLADSTQYFCDQIDRYSSQDFVPDEQDMLRARMATVGIVEFDFTLRGLTCKYVVNVWRSILVPGCPLRKIEDLTRVIDVGGQRSQRKKWIHCFDNVNALIFVAAMSEYNQVLMEDCRVNRMHESLKLFNTVINCQWFVKTSVVLFLNKKDLFEEKLKRYPLSDTFPEYKGGSDYADGTKFVELLFNKQKKDPDKVIYVHKTCATDTKNVEFVLDACFDILLAKSLARTGMEL